MFIRNKGVVIQTAASVILSVTSFLGAYSVVWPSYSLLLLQGDKSPIGHKVTDYQGGLIGSFLMLGAWVAPLIVGYLADNFGRKKTSMLCALNYAVGWFCVATAASVTQIIIGRLLIGVAYGIQAIITVVYVSEISHSSVIGSLCSISTFSYNFGMLMSYGIGWVCSYNVLNYATAISGVILAISMCWLKETPPYLLKKGLNKEALASLKFYRGETTTTPEIWAELEYLRSLQTSPGKSIQSNKIIQNDEENLKLNPEKENLEQILVPETSGWKILRDSKSLQRTLAIMSIFMVCTSFMGAGGVTTYAGILYTKAGLPSDLCSVIMAVGMAMGSGVTVIIMDLVPRRVLMISTTLVTSLCMAVLASQVRWSWANKWIVLLLLLVYSACYVMGAVVVPLIQLAECFPSEVKGLVSSAALFWCFSSNFAALIVYPYTVGAVGYDGTFLIFSLTCLLTAIISYFLMRETRKVPYEIIQGMFEDGFLYKNRMI